MSRLLDFLFSRGKGRFGGYELMEQIGRGGMSRIFKARDPDAGEICAVKVLTPDSAETQERFRSLFEAEEGQIALSLDHPNVIKTFDYGRGCKGEYYVAMEFVDGSNLESMITVESERLRRNRFDVLIQMARGLAYIHEQGLIHRDFCPKNVLYNKAGVAKVIDFGLTIPASVRSKALVTRAGTASYMAPEQIRNQHVDVRTDIYAFGVSAFEILTFRLPFPPSEDRARRMQTHLNLEPVPLRRVAPELPVEMETVIEKCVAKEPDMRYKSVRDVMEGMQVAADAAVSQQGDRP